ncbi:CHAT domain-containing protein [Laspinema olomoucense]|uniref:CHAT domain-containing protein n=1 Tax=Laspinema olomoucense D3b TaxID=2953688 RepID=A0ABT2NDZ0_9CYAN|nr:CHAT domain-containing protein [Laspinema sp. D3b]MCT7980099.1 CHAT domain-containing protein [Laspinema sp. D3b]
MKGMLTQLITRCRSRCTPWKTSIFNRRGYRLLLRGIAFLMALGFVTGMLPAIASRLHSEPSQVLTVTPVQGISGDRLPLSQLPAQSVEEQRETLVNQGRELYQGGRFAEALRVWNRAAEGYQQGGDRLNQALCLNYLTLAYQALGEWDSAEASIQESLSLLDSPATSSHRTGNPVSERIRAQALNSKGSLQLTRGEPEAALDSWKQAEALYQAQGDLTGALGSQINQAQGMQTLGLYRRSRLLLEQVNQELQSQPDSHLKITGLQNLGNALQVVGDLPEAQRVLSQSLAIARNLRAAGEISTTLLSLGNTARALEDWDQALTYYQEAAATATAPITKLDAQLNQLSLSVETQQWETARSLLNPIIEQLATLPPSRSGVYARVNFAFSALKMLEGLSATGEGEPTLSEPEIAQILATAVQEANALQDPRSQSYAIGELGHLYKRTGQFSDAKKLTQQALAIAVSINAKEIAARWQWQLGRILKQTGETQSAIAAYSEAVRSLSLLRRDLVAIAQEVQFSFQERVEPIYRELVSLLLSDNPTQDHLKQARETLEALQLAELENFFRQACLDIQPVQIDQVDAKAAAIYPIILPDRLEVILSIPGQPLRHYATGLPQSEVERTLERLLAALNPFFSDQERLKLSEQVYDWLIRPAEASLADAQIQTLVFVLDGLLRNLPMAALYDGGRYLVESYNIALTPGLQLLAPQAIAPNQLRALTVGLTEARQGFSALPGVARELDEISSHLPAQMILNQAFTADALKEEIQNSSFPVVHLATHGQFSSNPEDTFILTYDQKIHVTQLQEILRSRETGRWGVTQSEIPPIELLVFSACQTATGDKRAALGLAGVAVRSGARSTLATLWSVKDDSTSQLMADFYREFSLGQMSKAEALRRAQVALLQQPEYQHPFYWAPFILVGNWL